MTQPRKPSGTPDGGQFSATLHGEPTTNLGPRTLDEVLYGTTWTDLDGVDEIPVGDSYGYSRRSMGSPVVVDGKWARPYIDHCYFLDEVDPDSDTGEPRFVVRDYDYYGFMDGDDEDIDASLSDSIYGDDPMGDGLAKSELEAQKIAREFAESPHAEEVEWAFSGPRASGS